MTTSDEYGLYEGSWRGLITPDSFQHPAKMAYGLLVWIIETGMKRGYWAPGDLVGDPFGGIGSTGIVGASRGLRVVMVELEERFVELAKKNFELHRKAYEQFGDPLPVIVQGDSREFARIVGKLAGAVTSPPYAEGLGHGGEKKNPLGRDDSAYRDRMYGRYGKADGQIERLPAGTLDAAITSPPYAESVKGDHRETETAEESRAKRNTAGGSLGQSQRFGGYGAAEGNIGNLKEGKLDGCVTSPPFAGVNTNTTKLGAGKGTRADGDGAGRNKGDYHYPDSPENIGNLKEGKLDGCVTSPPWAKQMNTGGADGDRPGNLVRKWAESRGRNPDAPNCLAKYQQYGDSPDNIGNTTNETYWQAMRQVYTQTHLALKPGGICAVVVKDYVKKKQRVPLCDDTCTLLESIGFEVFERTRAWVVTEIRTQGLFGEVVERKSRKSFFRRLSEAKGSPPIDWEEVVWCRK